MTVQSVVVVVDRHVDFIVGIVDVVFVGVSVVQVCHRL